MTTPDCTLAPGALLEPLHIVDLTVEGGAVARHDGRVVFLDAGLPGESVQAEVTAVRKKIIEARRVRTLEPSPLAVQAWCPHAGDCGGCTLQELSPEGRLAWKENHVRQTLARIGKMQGLPVAPIIAAPKERGGRIRVAYAFGFDADGTFTLGLHRRASHEIVAVEECGLQRPEAGVILRRMRDALAGLKLPGGARPGDYLRRFIIHTPDYAPDGEPVIVAECLVTPERRPGDHKVLWGLLLKLSPEVAWKTIRQDFAAVNVADLYPGGVCVAHLVNGYVGPEGYFKAGPGFDRLAGADVFQG